MNQETHYQTVLLFGAPGTGKGTQGRILASIPGFFHLSCGDVFRTIDVKSEVGEKVYEYSSRGELVPDQTTVELWKQHVHANTILGSYKPSSDLLVLDGIPRSMTQAEIMAQHINVLQIIHLFCNDEEEMIKRLRKRALKENRIDDAREDVIRRRWEVYREETQPVLKHYQNSIISTVEAIDSPAAVFQGILDIVVPIQKSCLTDSPSALYLF
ncbi:adenylate kinase [Candidatus Poribacteria bacterium]|nr:adenylate kinase [Candidatus Poribacteria bacterium]